MKSDFRKVLPAVLAALALLFLCGSLRILVIRSGSMEPAVRTGGTVVVLEGSVPSEGDIAAYRLSGSVIVHRVIGRTEEGFVFQGDACAVPDALPVPQQSVLGRVLFVVNLTSPLFGPSEG